MTTEEVLHGLRYRELQIHQTAVAQHHDKKAQAPPCSREGKVTGTGLPFTRIIVHHLRMSYRLKSRRARMREQGYLTAIEVAQKLGVEASAVGRWARQDAMASYTDGKDRLYKIPSMELIDNLKKLSKPGRKSTFLETLTQRLEEVQYEA